MTALRTRNALVAPLTAMLLMVAGGAQASILDVAKALDVIAKANRYMDRLDEGAVIVPPTPMMNSEAEFVVPYTSEGELTEWATKAMSAEAGSAVGGAVGRETASRVPVIGGFLSRGAERRGAAMGAVTAIGGWDFIRETSDRSFEEVDDLAVYMHVMFAGAEGYEDALASAMAIYPDLEDRYHKAIRAAQKAANRAN